MNDLAIGGIFAKDIARPIEGVIKADDAEHLATEIDEYVLTGEIASALSDLLEAYTAPVYGGGNGVWISGFFGSGKSHLLKMLAHLLGDVPGRNHSRQSVVDAFTAKAEGDSMLVASLAKAARVPATCLLFNIDQKAPLIDKNQTDALLQVFVKVFNEARGYYSGEPSVARFERDLDRRGLLERFREAFAKIASVPWEQGREEGILQEHNVTQAWSRVTGEPPTEMILSRYEEQFTLSIEDFADEVAQWLNERPADHRLLFLVDEVGQFIGSDTKLMLNLQTIVESLNTKCGGRAWVLVTSQEDMDGVLGDRTKWQANDFSKIQARFATRMKLTSSDVEEVIEKRLLGKPAARPRSMRCTAPSGRTSAPCSTSRTGPRPTATTRGESISPASTPSCPTSSRSSRRHWSACRGTTCSRAGTPRSASAPCWASSKTWRRSSRTSPSAPWRPSTSCSRASTKP